MKFLGEHEVFLPTELISEQEELKSIDGHIVRSKGTAQISTLIQKMAVFCRLRTINVKVLLDNGSNIVPGNDCDG